MKIISPITSTAPSCDTEEPLVTGSIPVPDAYMTASSFYEDATYNCRPYLARLHGSTAWRPTNAERDAPVPNFYIQVSFDTLGLDGVGF